MKRKERIMDIEDIPYESAGTQEQIIIANGSASYSMAVCVTSPQKTVVVFGRSDGMKRAYAI